MGLAVADGQLFPIWAGNFYGPSGDTNDSFFNRHGAVNAFPLNIWYQPMTIAAGPRIISSTMGPSSMATSGCRFDDRTFPIRAPLPARRPGTPTSSVIPISGDPSLNISSLEVTVY